MWNGLPIVIFGCGGISREILYLIEEINNSNHSKIYDVMGFVESTKDKIGEVITKNYSVVTCDEEFIKFADKFRTLGVVIPIGAPIIKKHIYDNIKTIENIVFPNIIHPNVTFDKYTVSIGYGNIITSGVRLTNDINIGNFNLINLNSTVGHDCKIGNYNVINPGVTISGNICIKDCCLIGTGSNVLQQISIGNNVTVGAGSVVTKNIEDDVVVVGIPAKVRQN